MKQIHGGLTIDKVDATMDELREQHALGEEIASAITNAPLGEPVDETELEEELEGLEQEAMDERMLKSGTVPVGGEVARLPSVANGPSKFILTGYDTAYANSNQSTRQSPGRGRRRGRAAKAAGRNGDVERCRKVQPPAVPSAIAALFCIVRLGQVDIFHPTMFASIWILAPLLVAHSLSWWRSVEYIGRMRDGS